MQKELLYEIIMPNFPRTVRLSESRRAKYFKPQDKLSLKYLQKEIWKAPKDINIDLNEVYYIGQDNKGNYHKLDKNFIWKDHKLSTKRIEKRLYDCVLNDYVVKNSSVAGTPNDEIINGQKFYNGDYHPQVRSKIMDAIHEYMIPFLEGITPLASNSYPLVINGFMYDKGESCEISKGKIWDVGNRQNPYNKAFEDMLQKCGVIKQDDFKHIVGPPRLIFRDLDKGVDSKYSSHFPGIQLGGLCPRTLVYQIYKANDV